MTASTATAAPLTGARRGLTIALSGLFWLMAAGVVVQVFIAGLTIFGEDMLDTHKQSGWMIHTVGMLAIPLALAGPRTRLAIGGAIFLVVLNTVQILLSTSTAAAVAALHPTLALAVFGLSIWLALRIAP